MKIIAHTTQNGDRVLVEMTAREVANIAGKGYEGELAIPVRYARDWTGLEVGTEYKVSEIYQRLRTQEGAAKTIEQARKSALALADMFQVLDQAAVIVGPTEKKEVVQ